MTSPPYIALEGAEGSGKTTQAALLAEVLGAVLTRETGGTTVGKRLRQILHDNDVTELDEVCLGQPVGLAPDSAADLRAHEPEPRVQERGGRDRTCEPRAG